jgi:2,5-diketo-D-gluconate reductase A
MLGFCVFRLKDLEECERSVVDGIATGYRLIDIAKLMITKQQLIRKLKEVV